MTDSKTDPRIDLFRKLINCVKESKSQGPLEMSEINTKVYTDQNWFEYEKAHIFKDVPLIIGFSSMVKKSGEFFTFDHVGIPLLIVRGKDMKLRCFLNICRHRGVRLSNASNIENTRTFTCQYHHWSYDLEGKLIFVPAEEGFPNLDKSCRGLKELKLEEVYGYIWINVNPGGEIDLSNFLGNIASDMSNFNLSDGHFFKQTSKIYNANWKLIIEAFQDGYHVTRLHSKTVGGFFMDNAAVQEREKQHIRSIVARNEVVEALELPWDKWNFRYHGSFSYFIWPNTILIMHPDYTSQVSLYPISSDKTMIVHNCEIEREPQTEKALDHFERSFELIDKGVFASEDFYISEQAQIGLTSGANDTFLIGGYEPGIRVFHRIIEEAIGGYRTNL